MIQSTIAGSRSAMKPSNTFSRLFGAARKRKRQSKRSGLRLYIVKQIVEAHRGTISVESNSEDGTTFTISFDNRQKTSK
jgi:signal transduction histidine kinase